MEEKRYIKRKEKAIAEGNSDQLAIACNNLGDFYNQQGKYHNAVKEYQEEAQLYAKLGKELEMAKAHRMTGEMFMLLCEFDNAKDHINTYLKTAKKLHNKVEEQRAYATLGRAHLLHGQSSSDCTTAANMLNQLRLAEKAFLKSLLLIKDLSGQISKLEQLDMQARCYLNIGVVKEHMEEFEESIVYIEKAIKISKAHDIFELTHLCYISMSLLYFCKKNDSTLALRYANLALEVAKRLPNKVKKICETLITKAEILIKEGDFASAKQILTKAYKKNTPDENDRKTIEKTLRIVVKICQTLDELVTTSSVDYVKRKLLYEKLGDGCCHLQSYSKALEYYQKMLECAQLIGESGKSLVPIYVSLYQTYKDNKQYERALEYLWKEYELNKDVPAEAFSTLCAIADICELQSQSFWTVQDIYQKAKAQAAKAGSAQAKLERVVYVRLKKLMLKHKMDLLADELKQEANDKGIDLDTLDEDSDTESESAANEQNTPELGDDVCLDELTDSDMSDLDETEKLRPHRATRGVRSLTIKRNNKGETQLHQACITGNLELARRLLDQGHVVNVRDHAGWIPLHEASNHGFCEIVELLLDRGATVAINDKGGTSCDGITPLYDACSNGYLDVVQLLLERGADATVKTDFGETCLNALDKWRRTATLTEGEQAEYAEVRAKLLRPLSKVGICQNATPLTNANVGSDMEAKSSEELSPTDEEEDSTAFGSSRRSSHNRSTEGGKVLRDPNKPSPRNQRASLEYRNVMQQLKHPHRSAPTHDDLYDTYPSSSGSNFNKQKRSALLQATEIDDNDWLIDDLGPDRKKRRYFSTTAATTQAKDVISPTPVTRTSKENLHDSANASWELDTVSAPEPNAFQLLLETGASTTGQQRPKQRNKLSLSGTSSVGSQSSSQRAKTKHQASLLDSGFCRFRSESPFSSEDSTDAALMRAREIEPDSTTTSIHLLISPSKNSPIKVQAAPLQPTAVSFKVKVEEELLLVPVERKKLNDINMRWLAEEAARRYYNLVGLKPLLRLKTADGFAYEDSDCLNVAIEQNMILATVLEWKISPLAQRYEEMCHQLNKPIDTDVKAVLEQAQLSNSVVFEDYWLTPQHVEPLFRALMHQSNVRTLNLCNNFLQNEGCRQLAKSLPTLKQLKVLNLQGNFITHEGLATLFAFENTSGSSELEELNLSQNPLGNNSVRILDKICNSAICKTLQKLFISHCMLTNLYDFDLGYHQLGAFDISYNQLSAETLRKLLPKLNSSRLQYLNLSFSLPMHADSCSGSSSAADHIVSFFESGTCEKFKRIELCGLQLSDAHVYKLVQSLCRANELDVLDISDNEKLSGAALHFILDKLPQLRRLIATNCSRLVDNERLEELEQLQRWPNMLALTLADDADGGGPSAQCQRLCSAWRTHWGDKAEAKTCAGQIVLYLNDADLRV